MEAAALRHDDLELQEANASEDLEPVLKKERHILSTLIVSAGLTILRTHTLASFEHVTLIDWTAFYNSFCGDLSTAPNLSLYAVMLNYFRSAPLEFKRPITYVWGPSPESSKRWKRMFLTYLHMCLFPLNVQPIQFDGHTVLSTIELNFSYKRWCFDLTFVEKNTFVQELRGVMVENVTLQLSDDEGDCDNLLTY